MTEPAVFGRELRKSYDGRVAVDGIDFEVRPGSCFGFLGPNGAGKTTTLKMLTGMLEPSYGSATICGFDLRRDVIEVKRHVGFVPESGAVFESLTGLEYLQLAGGLRRLPETFVEKRANQLLELLALQDARWAPISAYSKGMKQRILIAGALLHDPDLLIFDEAQSGLDISNALLFRHLLRALAARGKAVLYISHILELVEKVCHRVIILYRGRIVADDSVRQLRDLMRLPNLEEIFTQLVHQEDMEARATDIADLISKRP